MSRYDKIKEQIAKLQKEKQGIENRRRAEERRLRTRRLTEIGALTLSHFNLTTEISDADFLRVLSYATTGKKEEEE
jgi:cell division protein FtsB